MTDRPAGPSLVSLDGIARSFGSVRALDGADLDLRAGEIHGVLGENGAGKTTLLNVLGGMLIPDSGTIRFRGETVRIPSPRAAWELGIGLVHQHFKLVPRLSVLENIALGRLGGSPGWRLRHDEIRGRVSEWVERTGLAVPLDAAVETLGVGDRQRVEILKALLRQPELLVLDEPTAVLAPEEVQNLFTILRTLSESGTGVVVVAHKLDEVLSVAHRVTVLRRGRTVLTADRASVDAPRLARAMVGEAAASELDDRSMLGDGSSVGGRPAGSGGTAGEMVAGLDGVSLSGAGTALGAEALSLEVRRGEIVGVAGVEGNGQRELALLLAGRRTPAERGVRLPAGIGFIPQDRTREGLGLDLDLVENVALAAQRDPRYRKGWLLDWGGITERAEDVRARYQVSSDGVDALAGSLSGGNQQRVVVGREITNATDLLVAENPTRGLDVAAAAFVHQELRELVRREPRPGVVLVSTDLDEVLELSDRIYAMVRGRLIEVPADAHTREAVGALMLGTDGGGAP